MQFLRPLLLLRWAGAFAVLALCAVTAWQLLPGLHGTTNDQRLAAEVFASHVRSLEANHLMDVASTDQHTVKPWFDGKLDFSPPVEDLASDGFPLVGGRLDYLEGHEVAALVYQRRKHFINVFVWPQSSGSAAHAVRSDPRGYHVISWTRGGMAVWVVSDLALAEHQQTAENEAQIPLLQSDLTRAKGLFWLDPDFIAGPVYTALAASGRTNLPDVNDLIDLSLLEDAFGGKTSL